MNEYKEFKPGDVVKASCGVATIISEGVINTKQRMEVGDRIEACKGYAIVITWDEFMRVRIKNIIPKYYEENVIEHTHMPKNPEYFIPYKYDSGKVAYDTLKGIRLVERNYVENIEKEQPINCVKDVVIDNPFKFLLID